MNKIKKMMNGLRKVNKKINKNKNKKNLIHSLQEEMH